VSTQNWKGRCQVGRSRAINKSESLDLYLLYLCSSAFHFTHRASKAAVAAEAKSASSPACGVPKRASMPSAAQRAEASLPVTKNASGATAKWGTRVQRLSRMYRSPASVVSCRWMAVVRLAAALCVG
jgi:hypothetical protein